LARVIDSEGFGDILSIAAHPFTTCGLLKEMKRQGYKPKVLVGLTSTSSLEVMQGCPKDVEGMIDIVYKPGK